MATFFGPARWIWDIPEHDWPYTFQVEYDRYVLPRVGSRARHINHSCEPNCVLSGRSVVALKGIRMGEEVTFDYSTDVDWEDFRMNCKCGSPKCRKVVRAYRFLPKRLKLEYGRNVAEFIVREYRPAAQKGRGQRK